MLECTAPKIAKLEVSKCHTESILSSSFKPCFRPKKRAFKPFLGLGGHKVSFVQSADTMEERGYPSGVQFSALAVAGRLRLLLEQCFTKPKCLCAAGFGSFS